MARSKWKLNYFAKNFVRKTNSRLFFFKKPKQRLIFSRSSTILLYYINRIVKIHKGNYFNLFLINIHNVGFKFGEFSITKKPYHFPLKKKKK